MKRAARSVVIDNFAGGGGASSGIEAGLGRHVDFAINHDPEAIALHRVNHPNTHHFCEDVWDVDPRTVAPAHPIGLGWFSPDCTFHSKARGGKPFRDRDRARRRRGLAWLVVRWIKARRPNVIMLENVEEFADWGPLLPDGTPCPERRGMTFRAWHRQIENLGYQVDMRELRACDYGAPTTRKRLFVIARCDGQEIVFPEALHGPGLAPYRTAAECIDWSLPCRSIFTRARPLADNTLRRIARGVMRYVVNNPQPFIVPVKTWGGGGNSPRSIDEPLRTITTSKRGEYAIVTPYIARIGQILDPYATITAEGSQGALVAAFLARHYGGHENDGAPLPQPIPTVTARDHHALVSSSIVKLKGTCRDGQPVDAPLHTIQASGNHYGEVRAFLLKYYGTEQRPDLLEPLATVRTRDCFALVTVHGQQYAIVDIGMRMLSPRELYRAQGFRSDYEIAIEYNGKTLSKEAQVMCGNSVSPPVAEALVRANVCTRDEQRTVA